MQSCGKLGLSGLNLCRSPFILFWENLFFEDFLDIDQPETRIAYGGHVNWLRQNVQFS